MEIMVAVVIIGVVAAIAVPQMVNLIRRAEEKELAASAHAIGREAIAGSAVWNRAVLDADVVRALSSAGSRFQQCDISTQPGVQLVGDVGGGQGFIVVDTRTGRDAKVIFDGLDPGGSVDDVFVDDFTCQ